MAPRRHPRFDQGIHDGAVAVGPKALASGALACAVAFAVAGPPADGQQQIGRVQQAASFRRRQCAVHVQAGADGGELELGHGITQGKRSKCMHPFRKGLQVLQDSDDRPVTPGAPPLGGEGGLEVVLKGARQPRRPGRAPVGALLGAHELEEAGEVAALHLLGHWARGHGITKVLLCPPR
jgi:hypothetical protein